jgi:tRNA(Ile)-lysidine synthase TilS/MesJ
MIKIQGKLPRKLYLACSGGVDSMVALDFLRRNHQVTVLHFNHGTEHGRKAEDWLTGYCMVNEIPMIRGDIGYDTIPPGHPVVTAHHLDDCVETWIFTSLRGKGRIIPYRRQHVIRPFRLTRKRDFELWAAMHKVPYIQDDSNEDIHYTRNYIRHKMMENVLAVNPGIHKTIAKKVREDES